MKSFLRIVMAAMLLVPSALFAQTLNFTVASATTGGPTITPRITWSTSPAAQSCTASGASNWTGTKGASGVVTLAAIAESRTYALSCAWPGTLGSFLLQSWTPPTTNIDGSAYTNPRGTLVAFGPSASDLPYSRMLDNPTATTYTVTDVAPGTYYVCVKAVNSDDRQSACSNIIQKVVTADAAKTISRTVSLTFVVPNAPTGLQ